MSRPIVPAATVLQSTEWVPPAMEEAPNFWSSLLSRAKSFMADVTDRITSPGGRGKAASAENRLRAAGIVATITTSTAKAARQAPAGEASAPAVSKRAELSVRAPAATADGSSRRPSLASMLLCCACGAPVDEEEETDSLASSGSTASPAFTSATPKGMLLLRSPFAWKSALAPTAATDDVSPSVQSRVTRWLPGSQGRLQVPGFDAAAETRRAIEAEVRRVRALPPAETASVGKEFTEAEAIFSTLEEAEGEATVLVRASWLRAQRGHRLPKRGSQLPPEALIGASELRAIFHAASGRDGRKQQALPFIAVSHFWRTKEHPDPDGETLAVLITALDERWDDFARCGVSDLGIFIDYCSLFQHPRTDEQAAVFAKSLKGINLWYAHQHTTVWLVTAGCTDGAHGTRLSYFDKGWCIFEHSLSLMIKAANTSVRGDWPQVVDLGKPAKAEQDLFHRPAPAEPLAFYSGHVHGIKKYTNGADRDTIVAPKFKQTIFCLLGGVQALNFNRLGWGDQEAQKLAKVLPLCHHLEKLEMVQNSIGDRGMTALARAMCDEGSLPCLRTIKLSYNAYGDRALKVLAKAVKSRGALAALKFLDVCGRRHPALVAACQARGIELKVAGSQRIVRDSELAVHRHGQPGVIKTASEKSTHSTSSEHSKSSDRSELDA